MISEINVNDLSLEYSKHGGLPANSVLSGLSFEVAQREVLAVLGESGSGKSSLLRLLAGYGRGGSRAERLKVTGGSAIVAGVDVNKYSRSALAALHRVSAFLPQNGGALLPAEMSVANILAATPRALNKRVDYQELGDFINAMFEIVQLPLDMLAKLPHELSKGQRQRVALMAALAGRPRVLLLDEPTNGVDAAARPLLAQLLSWYRSNYDCTVLMVCHDIGMLEAVADRALIMQRGQAVGCGLLADVFGNTEHDYVRRLAAALRDTAYDEAASRRMQ